MLLHGLPDAVDADLADFTLQNGGDFLGPVALMAFVEDSLHVFLQHGPCATRTMVCAASFG